jgi:hypothetical protein
LGLDFNTKNAITGIVLVASLAAATYLGRRRRPD